MTNFTAALLMMLSAAMLGECVVYDYRLDRDVDSWIERAQLSGDRADMFEYLSRAKSGLDQYDALTGHTAVIWKTPQNDLALMVRSIDQLQERLVLIEGLPESDVVYQVALDDIRDTVRELPNPGGGIVWVDRWWVVLLGIAFGGVGLIHLADKYA